MFPEYAVLNRPLAIVTKPDPIQSRCKKSNPDFDTTRPASRARHISLSSRPAIVARLRPPAGDPHREQSHDPGPKITSSATRSWAPLRGASSPSRLGQSSSSATPFATPSTSA